MSFTLHLASSTPPYCLIAGRPSFFCCFLRPARLTPLNTHSISPSLFTPPIEALCYGSGLTPIFRPAFLFCRQVVVEHT